MKFLITGASGYLGTSLVNALDRQGHRMGVVLHPSEHVKIKELECVDQIYYADLAKGPPLIKEDDYDILVHLAAANDVVSKNYKTALLVTSLGTRNMLELCTRKGIKRIMYFSTFQVYGCTEGFIAETMSLLPQNDYGITHRFAEEYILMLSRIANLEYIILRPTNIYGVPMNKAVGRWSLVPSCFCKQAHEEGKITLFSSGKQVRNFISLSDVINVTVQLAESFESHSNSIINLASNTYVSILDVAQIVKEEYERLYNKTCDIEKNIKSSDQFHSFSIDNTVIKNLGYELQGIEGLKKEISNIFQLLNNSK